MVTAVLEMIIAVMANVGAHFSVVTLFVSTVMGPVVAYRLGVDFPAANANVKESVRRLFSLLFQ